MNHQHQLGLVAVEAALTSLWPSAASSLKMQQFITVRVTMVTMSSHSDREPYKNLPQSDCVDTELLQQEPAAAAEGEETLTQSAEHRAALTRGLNPAPALYSSTLWNTQLYLNYHMLHTAIPQLPHVTYSYTSTTTCYIQLYINYHMLHTDIPQLPHVTYSYTSTTTCYIQLYLNYHMLHTAIPQLPHVTYSYTSTTTCYIQIYLNYHMLPTATTSTTTYYIQLYLNYYILHTAIAQLPHVTYSYTSTTTFYIQLYLNYHMLHTAIPQLPHVTYSYTSTTTCYIQLLLQLPHVTYRYTSTTTCYIQLYVNYHILHTAIPQLPHITHNYYLNYHMLHTTTTFGSVTTSLCAGRQPVCIVSLDHPLQTWHMEHILASRRLIGKVNWTGILLWKG